MDGNQTTTRRWRPRHELAIIGAIGLGIFLVSTHHDFLEQIASLSRAYEDWELDEIITVTAYLTVALSVFSWRRWHDLRRSAAALAHRNGELEQALSEIRRLRGIIPICSQCKKIRDDAGAWHQLESYIHEHSEADFSHGICPDCATELYPDLHPR